MDVARAREAMQTLEDVFTAPEGDAVVIESLRKDRAQGWVATVTGANYNGDIPLERLVPREHL